MKNMHTGEVKVHSDYRHQEENEHEGHNVLMFKRRFFISLILTIFILLLSPTIQSWLNLSFSFIGDKFVLFVLASIVVLWGGWPFFIGAKRELTHKRLGMMVLVSVAILAGYLYSVGATFIFTESSDFYWEISTLTTFLLFGHWMEMRAVQGASGALGELAKLIPKKANLVIGENIKEISTDELKRGDVILIKPGEKIPIDGIVIEGETSINESMITGESKPVYKKKGDVVIGGSVNSEGSIKVKVAKTGKDTVLNQIIELVKQAQSSKPRTQRLADKTARYLTIAALSVGILSFLYWAILSNQSLIFALTIAITVIVIACPHALGLAIPIVTAVSTTLAAQKGMLIKDMNAVETAEYLDYVVFDKTGTLTRGVFEVSDIVGNKTLEYAAAIEQNSEHVIGKGIVKKAEEERIIAPKIKNFKAIPGKGARGVIRGKEIFAGNSALMNQFRIKNPLEADAERLASQGKTIVYVADKISVFGIIALSDIIREESKQAISLFKKMGIKTAMLTGDNKQTAEYVANELGIDAYFAEVLPEDKVNKVKELQRKGTVAFVGDGINDAPALTQADIGIAIGAGTDVAVQSAEIILVKNNPLDVVKLIKLSKETRKKMKQNLWWAAGYNIMAIPVAAGVLIPIGIRLRPEFAALIMAASSIIVVINSLSLRKSLK
jgi:Cu2+-exporting ATPase